MHSGSCDHHQHATQGPLLSSVRNVPHTPRNSGSIPRRCTQHVHTGGWSTGPGGVSGAKAEGPSDGRLARDAAAHAVQPTSTTLVGLRTIGGCHRMSMGSKRCNESGSISAMDWTLVYMKISKRQKHPRPSHRRRVQRRRMACVRRKRLEKERDSELGRVRRHRQKRAQFTVEHLACQYQRLLNTAAAWVTLGSRL